MGHLTFIERNPTLSATPTIYVADVTLSFNETFQWTFSGLNVNVSKCRLDSIGIIMEPSQSNNTKYLVEETKIIIHNSSFKSLDLETETTALIIECYIDAEFKPRPTLITVNNSDVSIQNCHLENFLNEKGSTVLQGSGKSHVEINNSVFIQHNCSKGILFLQQNCSLSINNSLISQNVASSQGFSAITLQDGIYADIRNSVVENNSALMGGLINAKHQCLINITNCTFSGNKALGSGEIIYMAKQVELFLSSCWYEDNFSNHSGGAVVSITDVIIEAKDTIFYEKQSVTLWRFVMFVTCSNKLCIRR